MDLGTFFIDSVIVHDVPRRKTADTAHSIVFSEVPSQLGQGLKNFFRERTIRSLTRQAYEVERDPALTSPVPRHILDLAEDTAKLVSRSQEIARHLWSCQSGVNPAGLLVVCLGRVEGNPAVSILKLEREDAIRVQQTGEPGAQTFDIAHLRDLMLGKNTKLFKASLFTTLNGEVDGIVSDDQRGYDPRTEIAQFFLGRFLGCKVKLANDIATKAFFEVSQQWINAAVPEEAKRARYEIALLARMNAPTRMVTIKGFANENLDSDDRRPYREHMEANGVSSASITKDTQLIDGRIQQLTYATLKGIRVTGAFETMDALVKVKPDAPDGPVIEVRDGLKDVRGGR